MNMEDKITIKTELPNDDTVDIADMMVEAVDEMCAVPNANKMLEQEDQVKVKLELEPEEVNKMHSNFETYCTSIQSSGIKLTL